MQLSNSSEFDSEATLRAINTALLDHIAMLNQNDIADFRAQLSPEKQNSFDNEDDIEQVRLVALSKLTSGDRETLHQILSENNLPMLHLHNLVETIKIFNGLLN